MGLISDPWAGSWVETLAHLLIGHGPGEFDSPKPDPLPAIVEEYIKGLQVLKKESFGVLVKVLV
jgi:hypothetical protein